jgi:hypothetical protein
MNEMLLTLNNTENKISNNMTEQIEDGEPESSRNNHKKPSGALQLKESDKACEKCEFRKANASCSLSLCLQCCSHSSRACTYRGHVTGRKLAALETSQPSPTKSRRPTKPHLSVQVSKPKFDNLEHRHVYAFLENLHLERYAMIMIANGFDTLASLGSLDEDLLDAMDIKLLGHRALLLSVVSQIKL